MNAPQFPCSSDIPPYTASRQGWIITGLDNTVSTTWAHVQSCPLSFYWRVLCHIRSALPGVIVPGTGQLIQVPTHGLLYRYLHMICYTGTYTWFAIQEPTHDLLYMYLHMVCYTGTYTWFAKQVPTHGLLYRYLHMVFYTGTYT